MTWLTYSTVASVTSPVYVAVVVPADMDGFDMVAVYAVRYHASMKPILMNHKAPFCDHPHKLMIV